MKKCLLLFGVISMNLFYSQSDIKFDKYPAKVEKVNKAKLVLSSSSLGKTYKTQISNQYKTNKVDFGGHYVTTYWGAGMGLTMGAMVDIKTGKIYELPMNEENSLNDCFHNDEIETNKVNSNLFITYATKMTDDESKCKREIYYYLWNGKSFKLLKKTEKTISKD